MRHIGILGGTFDPVHYGHIRLAIEALQQVCLEQVRLIPVNIPPHRNIPFASGTHRKNMLELAIEDEEKLCIDLRELESAEVSYTINTLQSLRQEYSNHALYMIIGRDVLNKIDAWNGWQQLLDYAHIIVANRPGETNRKVSSQLNNWIKQHRQDDLTDLKTKTNGYINIIEIPMLDISSSMIRKSITKHKNAEELMPMKILSYIQENQLYMDNT